MRIALTGKTAHASMPETGRSPMSTLAELMPEITALGAGGAIDEDYRLVTVTHATLGEAAFGIAPGYAEIWATLRTLRDAQMDEISSQAEALARRAAEKAGLKVDFSYHDVFHHCDNDEEAVRLLRDALETEQVRHGENEPMRGSEDFGLFGRSAKSAMFLFGSGDDTPQLHNPDFDFPDALIEPGARIFMRVARNLLG
jgi:metal-dependent amidase/aminoacylase/carboxypeptidase family protein